MSRTLVLGAGSWGTTLALHLDRIGVDTMLWEFDPVRAEEIARTRRSLPFVPDHTLPPSITVTSDLPRALQACDVLVVAVPSHALRETAAGIREAMQPRAGDAGQAPASVALPTRDPASLLWVSATKGIEEGTGLTPRHVLAQEARIPAASIVVFAGPSFAHDVAAGRPTALLAACEDDARAQAVQRLFSSDSLRVYRNADPLGVEIGVSLKNVIAIAAGIAEGLGLGRNALGALVTRGLAEIGRLGARMGARPETFLGLAGIGDLVITCTSTLSRNYRVGLGLARGESLEHILSELQMVAEGVRTCRSACELARRLEVELPITEQIFAVLFEGKDPREAVLELMRRPLKAEAGE